MTFKVGDRIEIKTPDVAWRGERGVVVSVDMQAPFPYEIRLESGSSVMAPFDELELVSAADTPAKAESAQPIASFTAYAVKDEFGNRYFALRDATVIQRGVFDNLAYDMDTEDGVRVRVVVYAADSGAAE